MCRRTGRCPTDLLVKGGFSIEANITVNALTLWCGGMGNFVFRVWFEHRKASSTKGVSLVPHVILSIGQTEVRAWRVPEQEQYLYYINPQQYSEVVVAEKLVEALDWRETADRLYTDNVE